MACTSKHAITMNWKKQEKYPVTTGTETCDLKFACQPLKRSLLEMLTKSSIYRPAFCHRGNDSKYFGEKEQITD